MKFVNGIRLKDELTLDDYEQIGRIHEAFLKPPTGRFRRWRFNVAGYNGIIRATTTKKFVFFWHRRHINEIIQAHNMQGKADQLENKSKLPFLETVTNIITYFAVELKQTSKSIAIGTPYSHVAKLQVNLMRKKLEDWTMSVLIHHDPASLKKHADKLRSNIRLSESKEKLKKSKQIPGTEQKEQIRTPLNIIRYATMS